ncbi:DUF6907 domain-containing protein [Streptomyces fagopyri]|uniref:DUF6907 domain-containing protein n=1 Tax=Streptomyces fagopyri TaxID=2662397 RepID=UPI0036880E71
MSAEPPTVTLPTSDRGDVTIPEPDWCNGVHEGIHYFSDLGHDGPDVSLDFRGHRVMDACLTQSPFARRATRVPQISITVAGPALDAAGVYEFAAALDRYADQLRDLAAQLDAIRGGGQ